jgi:hypothetical protein
MWDNYQDGKHMEGTARSAAGRPALANNYSSILACRILLQGAKIAVIR